ncbi:hypothetical protein ACN42_g8796 [Penicillium freii]|uniref:Uncharacterized protein n=1 Tax=Penicillium freii TaxID=48697 RepID=A0A117NLZ4_PENFR|nr:hypothetical protein ACN42_g8796 [Penicillium freii]
MREIIDLKRGCRTNQIHCSKSAPYYLNRARVKEKKIGCFSLIERVILSAGAMLIFSVYFQLTNAPKGEISMRLVHYNPTFRQNYP